MSSIKKLTKKSLVELANDLGISNQLSEKTDLKQDYVEKIEQFIQSHPEAQAISYKHVQLLKANKSPIKKVVANGVAPINSSSVSTSASTSDEEVETEKETQDIETDEEIDEVKSKKIDLKKYFKCFNKKTSDFYSNSKTAIGDTYDDIIDYGLDKSDSLRELSSSPITIGLVETSSEFLHLYSHFISLTTIGKSKEIPSLIKDNLPVKFLKLPILDFTNFYHSSSAISIFSLWFLITLLIPSFVSYYINFTKPTKRSNYKYTLDPYIFTLTKFLLVLFLLKSELSFTTVKDEVVYKISGGNIFDCLKSFGLEGEVQLRLLFGPITLIANAVIATIALYAVIGK